MVYSIWGPETISNSSAHTLFVRSLGLNKASGFVLTIRRVGSTKVGCDARSREETRIQKGYITALRRSEERR